MSLARHEPDFDFRRPAPERSARDCPGRSRYDGSFRLAVRFRHEQVRFEPDGENITGQPFRTSFNISIPKQRCAKYPCHDNQGREEEEAALMHITYFSRFPCRSSNRI